MNKFLKNKILAIVISIFFITSMAASLILMPNVNAQTLAPGKIDIPTYAYINVAPNPAGVGQQVNVGFWLGLPPPTANGPYGDRWQNMEVTVILPDGSNQSLGTFTSDDTGGTHTEFTPSTVGNYTFQMSFPGQILAGANPPPTGNTSPFIGDYYEPSMSSTYTLTVQQSPVPAITQTPLPTNYWSRPIESVNNNWYTISGNWLGLGQSTFANAGEYNATSNYNPYTTAPTTAHILWSEPEAIGGLIGGEYSTSSSAATNFYSTSQYEPKFAPIILDGILYYTQYPGASTNPSANVAVNLQTGQTLWTDNTANYGGGSPQQTALTSSGSVTVLRGGQILDYVTPNQYGAIAYLWTTGTPAGITVNAGTTTYNLFDALTGEYILSVTNGPGSMILTTDQGGDLIGYYINSTTATAPTLCEWNSTQCIEQAFYSASAAGWEWRPTQDGIAPFADGIMWKSPIPLTLNGVPLPSTPTVPLGWASWAGAVINSGVILLSANGNAGVGADFESGYIVEQAYSTTTGQLLWETNRTETPYARVVVSGSDGNGVYVEITQETNTAIGYSLLTGKQLWTLVLPNADPYDSIGGYQGIVTNGVLYLRSFGGNIYAIDINNGTLIWQTNTNTLSGYAGSNTPYGVWPLWTFTSGTIAGGMLFVGEGHMYSPPLFRGASELAINITNGQLVWSIMSFQTTSGPAISDGIMTYINSYDNQIYAFGQGPSKTTVSAPEVGVTTATPITITGSVTDISAGSSQAAVAANFPNGLPCVSDASMTGFMEAVYMQQPMPTNLTGVPVTISVTDSNHNTYVIGTAISDPYTGVYDLTWTPDISGNYTVTAMFAGTGSYYGSTASAGFYASIPTSTSTVTPAPVSGLASNTTVMYAVAALIIVFIIGIAIVLLVVTRKHP